MDFLIITILNFVIATGMVLVVYYKWFRSDEQKDAEIDFWQTKYWDEKEKYDIQNFALAKAKDDNSALMKKFNVTKQSYIDELIEKQDEFVEMEGEYAAKVQNLETKLKRFDRNRDPKTGQFIKSNDE